MAWILSRAVWRLIVSCSTSPGFVVGLDEVRKRRASCGLVVVVTSLSRTNRNTPIIESVGTECV